MTEPDQAQSDATRNEPRRRRLLFRATHRGTYENDLLIGGFVRDNLETLGGKLLRGRFVAEFQHNRTSLSQSDGTLPSRPVRGNRGRKREGSALGPARGFAPWIPIKGRGPLKSVHWWCV